MPPYFASKNRTICLMLHDKFEAGSSMIDLVNDLFIWLFFSLFVEFVDLVL